jgi:hypothetical protein
MAEKNSGTHNPNPAAKAVQTHCQKPQASTHTPTHSLTLSLSLSLWIFHSCIAAKNNKRGEKTLSSLQLHSKNSTTHKPATTNLRVATAFTDMAAPSSARFRV